MYVVDSDNYAFVYCLCHSYDNLLYRQKKLEVFLFLHKFVKSVHIEMTNDL